MKTTFNNTNEILRAAKRSLNLPDCDEGVCYVCGKIQTPLENVVSLCNSCDPFDDDEVLFEEVLENLEAGLLYEASDK